MDEGHRHDQLPELLAPAGDMECLRAAVEKGADAVYFGGKSFSARAYAGNFTVPEIGEAVNYCHIRGVRAYVTLNTLVRDDELRPALQYARQLYESGVDGLIVQDIGLVSAVRRLLPGLEIHASTQMSAHNSEDVLFLKEQGCSRVILARELSRQEIARIIEISPGGIEVFVHGALCICYSGQCLFSSIIGARSGNRGRCAQPCRLPYTLVDMDKGKAVFPPGGEESHCLLSSKDLCLINHLQDLVSMDVSALKIEGRMKGPEYVGLVTRVFRRALDEIKAGENRASRDRQDISDLRQVFNRRFTGAYFTDDTGKKMMSPRSSGRRGAPLGRIQSYDAGSGLAAIALKTGLKRGDRIEILISGGRHLRQRVDAVKTLVNGEVKTVDRLRKGQQALVPVSGDVRTGDRVFKTAGIDLMPEIRQTFTSDRAYRNIDVRAKVEARIGRPLRLSLQDTDGNTGVAESGFVGEPARKHPLTPGIIRRQLERVGNVPVALVDVDIDLDDGVMFPISEINQVRRDAVESLLSSRARAMKRRRIPDHKWNQDLLEVLPIRAGQLEEDPELVVCVNSIEAAEAACDGGADVIYFGGPALTAVWNERGSGGFDSFWTYDFRGLTRQIGQSLRPEGYLQPVYVLLPCIIDEGRIKDLRRILKLLSETQGSDAVAGVVVASWGALQVAREFLPAGLKVRTDYRLNVFNSIAAAHLKGQGVESVTLSVELNRSQLRETNSRVDVPTESLVHGRLPLMISRHCVLRSTGSCTDENSRGCRQKRFGLRDRMNVIFPLAFDEDHHMYIFNSRVLCLWERFPDIGGTGIKGFRVDVREYVPGEARCLVRAYKRVLTMQNLPADPQARKLCQDYTTGHYFRGVE